MKIKTLKFETPSKARVFWKLASATGVSSRNFLAKKYPCSKKDVPREEISNLEAGFTLLMASLIGALLLAIGLAIFNLAFKELILSSSGRESQFAFYAADTGIECALFWDFKNTTGKSAFATSTASTISCNGDSNNVGNQAISVGGGGLGNPTSVFSLTFNPDPYCATVSVTKGNTTTLIESRGYNTCNTNNPRRVERAVRVEY